MMDEPSVTTVLSPFADFSGIRPEVLQHAADRGTRVHLACASFAKGIGVWGCGLHAEDMPFYTSFLKWADITKPIFVAIEEEYRDPDMGYMGHPDAIIQMPGEAGLTIIDYKTPACVSRSWAPQIAAYAHLARKAGYDIRRGFCVRLSRLSAPAIATEISIDGEPWGIFKCALSAYQYFNQGKKEKR